MKRALAVFGITILVASSVFAQVHIRENAMIAPMRTKEIQSVVTHDLRFVFSWDKGGGRIYVPITPCSSILGEGVYYGGEYQDSIVLEVSPGPSGTYWFDPQFCVACINPGDVANAAFTIYIDGVPVSRQTRTFTGSYYNFYTPWPSGDITFTTPYYSSFDFFVYSKWIFGDPYVPHITPVTNSCSPTSWSPATDPITLTIVRGSQYASIHQSTGGSDTKIGYTVITMASHMADYSIVYDGVLPDSSAEWVVVEARSNGMSKMDSVPIPGRPIVTISPSEISTGEIAKVTATLDWPGSGSIFPTWEAGIISGEDYGMLLTDTAWWGTVGKYFQFIDIPFWFMAADSIDSDSVMVEIRVGAELTMLASVLPGGSGEQETDSEVVKGNIVGSSSKTSGRRPVSQSTSKSGSRSASSIEDEFRYRNYGVAWVKVKKKEHSILLGETKYYQATKDPQMDDKIVFKELKKTSEAGEQEFSSVDFAVDIAQGDKLGVYWEKKDEQGDPLRADVIRLVGRYWEDGKTRKAKLSASAEGSTGSMEIEVKKPENLGTTPIQGDEDAYGKPQNVDNLVIQLAGKYGIPPQYLKGQIERESSFWPAYRYEPFVDVNGQREFSQTIYNRFRITSTDHLGTVDVPAHSNAHPPYLKYVGTVWDYLYAHSSSINPDVNFLDPTDIYPAVNRNGMLVWYSGPAERWQNIFSAVINYGGALDQAYAEANNWLEEIYADGNMDNLAQTRMASSYGLFQILYPTAKSKENYTVEDDHPPEKLNESQIGPTYAVPFLLKQVQIVLKKNSDGDSNWSQGYEETFRWAFSYYHNDKIKSAYGVDIVDVRSLKYSPSSPTTNP
jgi:hypothetical protein